jgi:subtilisin family serine protease
VIGGAPLCEIVPIKVLNDAGEGIGAWVAAGIDYAVANGCDILSMSLGGGVDTNITAAIRRAHNAGKIIICAAGNEGKDPMGRSRVGSPGSMAEVAAVAAYGASGDIAQFSSQGPEVDIAFPGVEIMSTWLQDQYRRLSGTSMATPICSAVMACRLSYQRQLEREGKPVNEPMRNNSQMLALLKKYAIDKGPAGDDPAWGWGTLDCVPFVNSAGGPQSPTPIEPPPTPTTTTTTTPPPTQPPPTSVPIAYPAYFLGQRVIVLDHVVYGGNLGTFIYPSD